MYHPGQVFEDDKLSNAQHQCRQTVMSIEGWSNYQIFKQINDMLSLNQNWNTHTCWKSISKMSNEIEIKTMSVLPNCQTRGVPTVKTSNQPVHCLQAALCSLRRRPPRCDLLHERDSICLWWFCCCFFGHVFLPSPLNRGAPRRNGCLPLGGVLVSNTIAVQ